MPSKPPRRSAGPRLTNIQIIKPLVEPVLSRLDRHEELLRELKTALDVQFKRTAAVQAQLDQLLAALAKSRR